jgi:hypothetical protein
MAGQTYKMMDCWCGTGNGSKKPSEKWSGKQAEMERHCYLIKISHYSLGNLFK